MNFITLPYPHNWHYQLNFVEPPFNDVRVRRAANYAMDRSRWSRCWRHRAARYAIYTPTRSSTATRSNTNTNRRKATELLKEANCYPCAITLANLDLGSRQMQPLPMNGTGQAQLEAVVSGQLE